MTSRLLIAAALVAPAAASSVGVPRLHALRGGQGESGSMPDPHDNIEPLDFGAALAAAKAAKESGLDADASAEAAAAVLGGAQRERTPLPSLHPGAGLIDGWLATGDARLLQHEIVTADGWEVTEAHRRLQLAGAPLPPWAEQLAAALATIDADARPPTRAALYGCEPGQSCAPAPAARSAVLTLGRGRADVAARRGPGACALDDRSLLDLDGADVDVELEATERTIFAVFAWD